MPPRQLLSLGWINQMNQEFDVFLSHSGKDKFWVRKFCKFLRSKGLSVFFDEDSIGYGESIPAAVGNGIKFSKHVLLIVTPDSTVSPWVLREVSLAMYSDPDSMSRKLIPIVLEAVQDDDIPPFILPVRRADFTSEASRKREIRRLITQIGIQCEGEGKIDIPISLTDINYQSKTQEYRETLQKCVDEEFILTPEMVHHEMMVCRERLRLEPVDIEEIEFDVLGTTLEIRLSTIRNSSLENLYDNDEEIIPEDNLEELLGSLYENVDGVTSEEELKEAVEDLRKRLERAKGKTFNFLLVGKTGVGKSSTINSLMDAKVAPTSEFDPCTVDVNIYETNLHGAIVHLIDTPGLCDELAEEGNDDKYIQLIREKVSYSVHAVLFVTKLDDTRVDGSEKRGLKILQSAFGESFWKKSVIVFTRADKVDEFEFLRFLRERTQRIHAVLSDLKVNHSIVNSIPSSAVDNTDPERVNPDGENLITKLYWTMLERVEDSEMKDVLLLATSHTFEKRGISPLQVAGKTAMAGVAALSAVYPAAVAAHLAGIGATTVGTAVGGTGSVVLTGVLAFSNPIGWAFILGTAAAAGGLAYRSMSKK